MTKPRARYYEISPGIFSPLNDGETGPSELATPETAGPAKVVAAVATGSLPVSSAEVLEQAAQLGMNAWLAEQYAVTNPVTPESGERSARHGKILRLCEAVLRRHAAAMTERQPEENSCSQPRREDDV